MTMRASLIISAKDDGASAAFSRIGAAARSMGEDVRHTAASAQRAEAALAAVGTGAPASFARIGTAARAMGGAFSPMTEGAFQASRVMGTLDRDTRLMFQRVKGSGAAFRPVIVDVSETRSAFARLGDAGRRLGTNLRSSEWRAKAFGSVLQSVGGAARSGYSGLERWSTGVLRTIGSMHLAERAAYGLGAGIGTVIRKTAGFAITGATWGAGLLGAGLGLLTGGAISTGAKFEQFGVALKTVTGSAEAAKKSMSWVQQFAATTPYELDEVLGAFVKLKTRGMDPTDGTLRSLGDSASAMGKSIDDAVEMMADAVTGEFERLKEFGVTASQAGDKVTFRWMKNGKTMTETVKKDGTAIRKALIGIFDGNYGGAMAGQSKTFAGMISNLKDQWTSFQKMVADAGIFDLVKQKLAGVLDWVNRLAANGTLKAWAQQVSDKMVEMFNRASEFVKNVDWKSVADGIGAIVDILIHVVGWIGRAAGEWRAWQNDVQRKRDLGTVGAPNAAFVGGVRLWGVTQQERQAAAQRLGMTDKGAVLRPGAHSVAPWKPTPRTTRPWSMANTPQAKPGASVLKPGAAAVTPWAPARTATARRSAAVAPKTIVHTQRTVNDVKVGGKVAIEVKAAPGTQARATTLASANRNVPIAVRTGRAMTAAA